MRSRRIVTSSVIGVIDHWSTAVRWAPKESDAIDRTWLVAAPLSAICAVPSRMLTWNGMPCGLQAKAARLFRTCWCCTSVSVPACATVLWRSWAFVHPSPARHNAMAAIRAGMSAALRGRPRKIEAMLRLFRPRRG